MRATRPVLVVEDHQDTRELLVAAFEGEGFAVLTARHGREALDLLLAEPAIEPMLIVLDLEMPVMSGWEFLDVVRRYRRLAAIPVVVQSGIEPTPIGAPVAAVFKKPLDVFSLMARMKNGEFGT